MLSDVMEDYLKTIYMLQREHGPPVRTSTVADALDVTSPTVTSMLEKLEDRGFVTREKYKGVELTEDGDAVALEVLRHHRLLEAYLAEHLDYEWSEVHDEADALEHHISEEFERRVADALGDPRVDPHGDPIPSADLTLTEDDTVSLAGSEPGDEVVVARVSDRDDEELRYLSEVGVEPGTTLTVSDTTPIGTLVLDIEGETVTLPESVAATIRVRPAAETQP
ncbi:metal-dependent transcriptional regulator [Salarchaeum sp. JOR-1]|uniref:metal-dependent transcriptional regulator n=1 Tax=Salarchaeum sp. JOR-1 TaxID=2599399 RepID=UPI0011982FD8|nr:metal-dependent transcriptional regulator [Salarchaeum sp. JOR-1]QDX41868.1 metal-dependent transcriptional regulator [Salarchaeum sp. JOR-1]